MYYSTTYLSPLGRITLACEGDNLVGVWNEGQKYHGAAISEQMTEKDDMPVFDAAKNGWMDISPVRSPPFPNCRWLQSVANSGKTYGLFYVKYHTERLLLMATLPRKWRQR